MNAQLPATQREQHPIRVQMEQRGEEIRKLLPATLNADKFLRVVYDALNRNRDLLACTPQSVVDACASAARDGLLLDGREAALVIFKGRAQYIPMVMGLRKRIFNTGLVEAMQTGVVYRQEIEQKRFEYQEGTEGFLRHAPDLLWSPPANEMPVAAYSLVTMKGGAVSVEVMRWTDIKRVSKETPIWKTHPVEMARKTVLRRHAKSLPFSSDMFGGDDEPDVIDADEPTPEAVPDAPQTRRRGAAAAAVRAAQEVPAHDPETGEVAGDDPYAGETMNGEPYDDTGAPAAQDDDRF